MRNQVILTDRICRWGGLSSALMAVALLTAARPASGQTLYRTSFEPDTFLADTPLVGQDGWVAPPPLSPNAAIVSADKPRQGQQTVHVLGADLEHQDFINEATGGYYDAIGSYRRPVNYDTGGSQTVRISAHVRVDGPRTASGNNFFSAGVAGRVETAGGTASVGELAISSDGHVFAYSGNDGVPTFLASKRVKLGQWHNLTIIADFATHTSRFYADDHLLTTFAWEPSEAYTGVLLRGTMLAYAAPDTTENQKADYAAHYDKFSIKALSPHDGDDGDDDCRD
jgi:hypothetical protein